MIGGWIALSWSLAGALGSFGGGLIMSRLKLTPAGAVKMIMLSSSGFVVGVIIFIFLGCPQINMAGHVAPDDGRYFCLEPSSHVHLSFFPFSFDRVGKGINVF